MNDLDAKNYIEALIFSASEPLSKQSLKKMLSEYGDFNLEKIIDELKSDYESRGVVLMSVDDKFYFRTSGTHFILKNGFFNSCCKTTCF